MQNSQLYKYILECDQFHLRTVLYITTYNNIIKLFFW